MIIETTNKQSKVINSTLFLGTFKFCLTTSLWGGRCSHTWQQMDQDVSIRLHVGKRVHYVLKEMSCINSTKWFGYFPVFFIRNNSYFDSQEIGIFLHEGLLSLLKLSGTKSRHTLEILTVRFKTTKWISQSSEAS